MRTAYVIVISIMLVVLGLVFYPSLHSVVSNANVTVAGGFLPLVAMAVTLLPYAFLGFIVYAIFKTRGR